MTHYAFGFVARGAFNFDDSLDAALRAVGFVRGAPGEVRLYVRRHGLSGHVIIEQNAERFRALPRAFARHSKHEVEHFEVTLREPTNDSDEYECTFESSTVHPDGGISATRSETLLVDYSGDAEERLGQAIASAMPDDAASDQPADYVDVSAVGGLSLRLRGLAVAIGEAGRWTLERLGDRYQVRVLAPDGTRRVSLLDSGELEALRAEAVIAPESEK